MDNYNQVTIKGYVATKLVFSHEVMGEKFFVIRVMTFRDSGTLDSVPVMISERLLDPQKDYRKKFVSVKGEFRSHNQGHEAKKKLLLYVLAKEIDWNAEEITSNEVELEGFVCKLPVYRETPLGKEIADVLIAVNRPYGKADYIPCIFWGRNARHADELRVGDKVFLKGRFQSRKYTKLEDGIETVKEAYEMSVHTVRILSDTRRPTNQVS